MMDRDAKMMTVESDVKSTLGGFVPVAQKETGGVSPVTIGEALESTDLSKM